MQHWMTLNTPLGPVRTWQSSPARPAHGGVVVLQEIFGVTAHIRRVADGLAEAGHAVLAPSLFDPVQPDVELPCTAAGTERGRHLAAQLGFDGALDIVRAASRWLREAGHPVAAVGFCWGGSVAYLANTRLGLPAVSYYGARTLPFLHETLQAPMLFHFGRDDALIPPEDIQRHRLAHPDAAVHVYPGGHAFSRDDDPAHFHPASAALAGQRTRAFLAEHLHD